MHRKETQQTQHKHVQKRKKGSKTPQLFFRHITPVVVVVVFVVFVSMVIGVMMSQVVMNSIENPIVSLL